MKNFMKKVALSFITVLIFITVSSGCSNDKGSDSKSDSEQISSEKGLIKTFTEQTAKEAMTKIDTPIEKARAVKDKQEGDFENMEKTLKN